MKKIMTGALVVALTAGVAMGANVYYDNSDGNWNAYKSVDGHGWNTLDLSMAIHAASPNGGRTVEVTTTNANANSTRIGNNGSGATVIVRNGGVLSINTQMGFGVSTGPLNIGYMTIENGGTANAGTRVWLGTADTGSGHLDVQAGGVLNFATDLRVAGHNNSTSSVTIAGIVNQTGTGWMAIGSDSITTGRVNAVGTVTITGNGVLNLKNIHATGAIWDGSKLAINGINSKMVITGDKVSIINDYVTAGKIVTDAIPPLGIVATYNGVTDLTTVLVSEPPADPYVGIWTNGVVYGQLGTAPTEDYDTDGVNNLYEYALNGNMQSAGNTGTDPVFAKDAGETFVYTVVQRTNDLDLVYSVQSRPDLLSGDWTNTVYNVLSTTPLIGDFSEVKYSIPSASNLYIRLKITRTTP